MYSVGSNKIVLILVVVIVISSISYFLLFGEECEFVRYNYGDWEKDCGGWGNKQCEKYTCSGDYKQRTCYETRSCKRTRKVYRVMKCDGEIKREFARTETEILPDEQKSYEESEYNQFCHYLSVRPDVYLSCEGHVDCYDQDIKDLAEKLKKRCEREKETMNILSLGIIPDDCTAKDLTKKDLGWVYNNIEFNETHKEEGWWVADASEVLERKEGVCSHHSILFAAVAREQGMPTKVIEGCAVPECEWWEIWCSVPMFIFGKPGHIWNQVWVYSWEFADSTGDRLGKRVEDVDYYREEVCNVNTNDCFFGPKCRK